MRLTKLQIVQDILSTLDIDNISTLSETPEADQVEAMVDKAYDEINAEKPWPHLREFTHLELTSTSHIMKIPDGIMTVSDIWYNSKSIEFIIPKEMFELLASRDTTESNIDSNGAYNDQDPVYWSSYDDTNIIFDRYNSTLVSSLSYADAYRMPSQMTADSDYPDLPERFHKTLYYGALADAFYTLKGDGTGFNIYRNRFKRDMVQMQRWARRINRETDPRDNVNYGRKWA